MSNPRGGLFTPRSNRFTAAFSDDSSLSDEEDSYEEAVLRKGRQAVQKCSEYDLTSLAP